MPDRLGERGVPDHGRCRSAAGDGGKDYHDVAIRGWSLQTTAEADILVVDVDIHETTQPFRLDNPVFQARVANVDVVEHLLQGRSVSVHSFLSTGERAEDRRDPH